VTFEIERFEWGPGALEVSGRWRSDAPRRFRHVRLVVGNRRIAPMRATPMRATPDGHPWSATFPWTGSDAPDAPLLEAGHDLLVELPAPDRVEVLAGDVPAPDTAEIVELRETVAALRGELAELQERLGVEAREVETQRAELETARAALAAEREELEASRATVVTQLEEEPEPEAPPEPTHPWHFHPAAQQLNGNGNPVPGPRHAAIQHALERPRQPDDHVRGGHAPLPVRIIAVALCSGVVVMLAIILGAIF
jgi:hypothetical protein